MVLTWEDVLERVAGDDVFRIVTRGQAAIEQRLDEGLEAAFPPEANMQPRSFGDFEQRVDVAIAMGLTDARYRAAIFACSRLRDDLAHGRADDVSVDRAQELLKGIRGIAGPVIDMSRFPGDTPVHEWVRRTYLAVFRLVAHSLELAESERELVGRATDELHRRTMAELWSEITSPEKDASELFDEVISEIDPNELSDG